MKKGLLLVLCLVLVMSLALGCSADSGGKEAGSENDESGGGAWPEKDLEVVYHSKAGSGGDIFLRAMGKAVESALGKAWVVNNMPGASGATAFEYVAKADPDGHTLLGVSSTIVTAPLISEMDVTYEDFEPVCMMFTDPMVIFVAKDSPWETLDDFIQDAKANPGKYNIAGGTPGEIGFVVGMELQKAGGFEVDLVPFEGGGDSAVSVLGGHVDGGIGEYAEISSSVEAGELRILCSFNEMPDAPDIPTVAELGYPEVKVEKLRGVVAPKGTPKEVIDKLNQIMQTAYDDPDFKEYIKANNLIPNFKSGDDFKQVMDDQTKQVKESLGL